MRPRLLVVGFGPFPGIPRNPSAGIARLLAAHPRLRHVLGGRIRLLVMRTAYAAIGEALEPALAEHPEAVLMFGVAMRRRGIHVEALARNRVSRLFPDASGRVSSSLALRAHGPDARRSPHAGRAVRILRSAGLPARLSRDAGRYLCNASYYRALADGMPTLFVHLPAPLRLDRPRRTASPRRASGRDSSIDAFAELALRLVALSR